MGIDDDLIQHVRSARNKRKEVYVVRSTPSEIELRSAAEALGLSLPESYVRFCTGLGIGDFNDELRLLAPRELYAFDMPGLEFNGYIAIATDDLGNYLAFNPAEAIGAGDRTLYYHCHDPFGFGEASRSFGEFMSLLVSSNFDYHGIVDELPSFREVELPESLGHSRPWWKLW